jgi:hypothetical protein
LERFVYRNAQDNCPERPTWFVVKRKQKPFSNQETMTTTKSNPVQTVQPDGYTTMLDTTPEPGAVN